MERVDNDSGVIVEFVAYRAFVSRERVKGSDLHPAAEFWAALSEPVRIYFPGHQGDTIQA